MNVMNVIFKNMDCPLAQKFAINNIKAEIEDFGTLVDMFADDDIEYGCPDREYTRYSDNEHKELAKTKYKINDNQYETIQLMLESIQFHGCGWCE